MRTPLNARTLAALSALRWVAALLVLAAVFGLYGRADFLMQLANQLWTCF
jgi:hypothetical protein